METQWLITNEQNEVLRIVHRIAMVGNATVAEVPLDNGLSAETNRSNAHTLIAAPIMLSLLVRIREVLAEQAPVYCDSLIEDIDQAIMLARGQSKPDDKLRT